MAKPKEMRPYAHRKYDWEGWFARPCTIVRWVHYDCSQAIMSQQVRTAACRRGLKVSVIDVGYGLTIKVRDEVQHTDKTTVAR